MVWMYREFEKEKKKERKRKKKTMKNRKKKDCFRKYCKKGSKRELISVDKISKWILNCIVDGANCKLQQVPFFLKVREQKKKKFQNNFQQFTKKKKRQISQQQKSTF